MILFQPNLRQRPPHRYSPPYFNPPLDQQVQSNIHTYEGYIISLGSATSPIKCAAISNLAQKLASPTLPFSTSPTTSTSLPPALLDIAAAQTSESTLSLNKPDDVDLKETLIDLDELLKKELEGVEKDVPEEDVKEPVVEAEPEKEEEKVVEKADEPKIEPEEKNSEILEVVTKDKEEKEEKEDEVFDSDNRLSRRVGRPRKTTETETKTKPTIEEDQKVSKKKEKEEVEKVEKAKMSKPGSPRSRQASPSPEVKTRSGSREPPTKRSNSGQEQMAKKIDQPIPKKVEPSQTKKLEPTPVKKPVAPVEPSSVESAPASPELTAEEIERQVWKKSILAVLGKIMLHKHAHLFNSPVSEAVAPEYRDLVYRPMDLGSIKKNIESGHIDSTEGMLRDINLVFLNAIMYNSRYAPKSEEPNNLHNVLLQ